MKAFDLETAARWCGGKIVQGDPKLSVTAVATDTRTLCGGELFVALRGENFDAHDFLGTAEERGSAAVLVSEVPDDFAEKAGGGFPLILVEDTLAALQALAREYRQDLNPLVVAVTGSNGKTSTKDFLAAALATKFRIHATAGNLNNHIGLPLTLLSAPADTECVVCEIGMSNPGEIAPLAEIAAPDIAVITNIGTAHIEFMGTREAIALEKGALAEAVGAGGWVILNAGDAFSDSIANRTSAQVVRAGVGAGEIHAEEVTPRENGVCFSLNTSDQSMPVELPVPGHHMVGNAVLAAAAALVAGAELSAVARALSGAQLTGGRLQRMRVAGLDILDDSYNANPDSVRAALVTLMSLPCEGRRIAVLGRMAELGAGAVEAHTAVGAFAADQGVDAVISVGSHDASAICSAATGAGLNGAAIHFDTPSECAEYLIKHAGPRDIILVKGSRSSHMEAVIELLSPKS